MRLLASRAAEKKSNKMHDIDISRAYFCARSTGPKYVKLPAEDSRAGESYLCGRLLMSVYGTMDVALNWADEYSATLVSAGYTRGVANPCPFHNKKTSVCVMVHGDGFLAVCDKATTDELKKVFTDDYKVKCGVLGDGYGEVFEIWLLNVILRRTESGLLIEADPRHVEMVIKDVD